MAPPCRRKAGGPAYALPLSTRSSTGHTVSATRRCPAAVHEEVSLTVISPSERMGDASDAVFWKRENIERWVALGRRDAASRLGREPAAIRLAS